MNWFNTSIGQTVIDFNYFLTQGIFLLTFKTFCLIVRIYENNIRYKSRKRKKKYKSI